jgi:hypothetical protein
MVDLLMIDYWFKRLGPFSSTKKREGLCYSLLDVHYDFYVVNPDSISDAQVLAEELEPEVLCEGTGVRDGYVVLVVPGIC